MGRAAFDAFSAAAALCVVDDWNAFDQRYRARLAKLFALAALDAAVLAVFHNRRLVVAPVLAKRYRALRVNVEQLNQMLGAGADAAAATRAVFQIDVGKSVLADNDTVKLAGGRAIAKARAAE